jgi:PncC family amidohydrolase
LTQVRDQIRSQAHEIARRLASSGDRLVLAESCTAGLVAASLARVPGISRYLCGSAVTYREATKTEWLSVAAADLDNYGAVSEQVTRSMAANVLLRTSEATLAAAITGHLGPDAPVNLDGQIYMAVAWRDTPVPAVATVQTERAILESADRVARQDEAAYRLLDLVRRCLADKSQSDRRER